MYIRDFIYLCVDNKPLLQVSRDRRISSSGTLVPGVALVASTGKLLYFVAPITLVLDRVLIASPSGK